MTFDRYPSREEIRGFQAAAKRTLQENVAKRRFWFGFLLLPWLWFINAFHFRDRLWDEAPENSKIRYYARASGFGFVVVVPMFIAWMFIYHNNWSSWGKFGEDMALIIPKGA